MADLLPDTTDPTVLRQRRAFAIADDVYDLPEAEREGALAEACGDDGALREAVEALLAFDDETRSLLQAGIGTLIDEALAPPEVIGGYRLGEELGRGGMGVVYAAERADGVFEKAVALKLVRAGVVSAETARRFDRERRVLARLDHPGIARLLDGGVTEAAPGAEGRAYFVMERVDGEPITDYAERHGLGLEARLALALDVCDAVAHAHRLLIVHRDLKPSNVLVAVGDSGEGASGKGEGGNAPSPLPLPSSPAVKLLDFGIAKVLDEDDDDLLTRTGTALTPAYAAPEQVTGDPVTAATDVYALGVLLYELLVGRRPYAFRSSAPAEVARVVCETDPARPSAAATRTGDAPVASEAEGGLPAVPAKRLRGDLDAILLQALRKEPERRYATAADLADDLRRHLDGRPVEARGDGLGYRASRFARRHRAGVAAAATLVVALLGGVAAVLWQARETAREAARANATLEYVLGTFEAVDPEALEGGQIRPRDLLEPGLRQAAALDGQPLVQASLLEGLGRLGVSLGLFPTADSLLQQAVEVRRLAQGSDHPDLATPLTLLTESRMAERRYDEAIEAGEEAVRLLASGRDPDALAAAQVTLAYVLDRRNDTEAATSLFRAALDNTNDAEVRVDALTGLAEQIEADSLDVALDLYRSAGEVAEAAFGPTDPRTAAALYAHASAAQAAGDVVRAKALHEQALGVYERVFGRGDHRTARSLYTLAVLHHADDAETAERYYRGALDAYASSAFEAGHLWTEYTRAGLGGLLVQAERFDEALPYLDAASAVFADQLGEDDTRTLAARAQRSIALIGNGRVSEGLSVLREVEEVLTRDPSGSSLRASILERVAVVLQSVGRTGEAQAAERRREAILAE
ncbi:MAG: serine/threonine-protein kinase [Bacteroidota bacterium]